MKYTVVWQATAENDLGEIWLRAADQQAVADAADHLESVLRKDPERLSTQPVGVFHDVELPPLAMRFHVSKADLRVTVISVWRIG